ncbi:MAG: YeeE/YedE family protein [Inhella sp.]
MSESELASLRQLLLGLAFVFSAGLGAIAQRTHFCVMGAVSDVVLMQDWTRARMWALAVAVAVAGFALLGIPASQTLYGGSQLRWASLLLGGLLFGAGMVLASGCGAKTLVRLGSGNLKALVVLLVMGLSAFMTLRGLTAVWRDASVDKLQIGLTGPQDLASLSGLPLVVVVAAALLLLLLFALRGAKDLSFWLGGIGTGLLVVAMWWLTGQLGFVAEHPETLEASFLATAQNRPEAFSFVAPSAGLLDWLLFFSDRSKRLDIGVVALLGVIAGAAASALLRGEFRWEGFRQTDDLVLHLMGAVLMGVGGVTALGCTFGQGLSGLSTLSLGSLLAAAGIVAGAWLALRWQLWRADRA